MRIKVWAVRDLIGRTFICGDKPEWDLNEWECKGNTTRIWVDPPDLKVGQFCELFIVTADELRDEIQEMCEEVANEEN